MFYSVTTYVASLWQVGVLLCDKFVWRTTLWRVCGEFVKKIKTRCHDFFETPYHTMVFYTHIKVIRVRCVNDDFDVFVKQNVVSYMSFSSKRISKITTDTTHTHHIRTYMLYTLYVLLCDDLCGEFVFYSVMTFAKHIHIHDITCPTHTWYFTHKYMWWVWVVWMMIFMSL